MAEYKLKHTGAQIDTGIDAAFAAVPKSGGAMTGPLTLSAAPSSINHAANKGYVDDMVNNIAATPGEPGADGEPGASAFEIAVDNGFEGNETEWLASLKGPKGDTGATGAPGADGKSAYAYAQDGGYTGTEAQFGSDLNNAIRGGGSVGGTADSVAWGNITGKPFGNPITGSVKPDGDTLAWDGSTDGMIVISGAYGGGMAFVSENTPTLEQLQAGCRIWWKHTSTNYNYYYDLIASRYASWPNVIRLLRSGDDSGVVYAYVALVENASDVDGNVFPRAGVYFNTNLGGYIKEFTVSGYAFTETEEIAPIPEKYLPERTSFIMKSASGARWQITINADGEFEKTAL